jgi:hypothetical protein
MHSIVYWWKTFWDHTEFWNAFWPALIGGLAGAVVGAVTVTSLERLYRTRERLDREVGECNKLLFIVGQMLWALADINGWLFEGPRKKLGREPAWSEVGALEGTPDEGPEFIIGEYTFLLEDDDPESLAPQMLTRVYTAEANFKAILARLHQRNQLWHEYKAMPPIFGRGSEAIPGMAAAGALNVRLKEQTVWLAEDLPESIKSFEKLLPELRNMLTKRYPKRHFIRLWSNDDPSVPPL